MAYQPIINPLPVTGSLDTSTDPTQLDAFGRLRVSQLTSQIDLKQVNSDLPLLIDKVTSGTGAESYVSADSLTSLTTAANSDYAIAQTKQSFNYQSGKSFLMFMTFANFDSEANVTKKIGYYTSSTSAPYTANLDGLFLQNDGSNVSVNIYKNGSATETTSQASWNMDTLDGAGPSGITVDWAKAQILMIDFEWLGVGRVRWALVIDGAIVYFHESKHANVVTSVYMQSPNKPLRWEIRQTGAGSGTFKYICATVATEGTINNTGKVISANNGSTWINANVIGTNYALLGLRLKSTDVDTVVNLINTSTLAATADDWLWELRLNPTVAGTFTYSGITNSALELATGATTNTVSGGTIIASGYGAASNSGGMSSSSLENALRLGSAIDGTQDTIVISAIPLSSNLDIFASITWRELQ